MRGWGRILLLSLSLAKALEQSRRNVGEVGLWRVEHSLQLSEIAHNLLVASQFSNSLAASRSGSVRWTAAYCRWRLKETEETTLTVR